MTDNRCPHCRADLTYGEPGSAQNRRIGVEIPGAFDGALYYQCPDCDGRWHALAPDNPRYELALYYINVRSAKRPSKVGV